MAEVASKVVVLTESDKFGQHSAVPLRLQGKPTMVVTDANIDEGARRSVESLGISVLVAT